MNKFLNAALNYFMSMSGVLTGAGIDLVPSLVSSFFVHKLDEARFKKEYARSKIEGTYQTIFDYREAIVSHLINMSRYVDSTNIMSSINKEDIKVSVEQALFFRLTRYVFFNNREIMDRFTEINNIRKNIMQSTTEVMVKKPHWKRFGHEETETLTKYKIYLDSLNLTKLSDRNYNLIISYPNLNLNNPV